MCNVHDARKVTMVFIRKLLLQNIHCDPQPVFSESFVCSGSQLQIYADRAHVVKLQETFTRRHVVIDATNCFLLFIFSLPPLFHA